MSVALRNKAKFLIFGLRLKIFKELDSHQRVNFSL